MNNTNRHGSYDILCEEKVIYVCSYGSWNNECFLDLFADILKKADTFQGQPWGFVVMRPTGY
ncbi:hypothetical protein L4C34_19400 [Vibrio profundum]|uniref:hypothetical protein n=1 Tax=Vibrio profundum TaxID=2910247 RepID=UPI003D0F1C9E